ncbi:MAG: lysophospholipid acyltransferase family protein [Candidatus Dormibacterales bacterium]
MASPERTAGAGKSLAPSLPSRLLSASYFGGARALRFLPTRLSHAAASPGGTAWFWLSRAQRRNALDNYAAAMGREPGDPAVHRVARQAFQNYGRMLMEFLLIGDLTKEEVLQRATVEGREHVDAALARGRGVIAALPHMGSWDTSGLYAAALGYDVVAVADRFPPGLNEAVVRTRQRIGVEVIFIGRSTVRTLTDALRANRVVALVCDLEHGPGVEVDFFGRRAVVPSGPAALALKTGAALLTVGQYSPAFGRHHIHVDPGLSLEGHTKETLMQQVVHRFEGYIRERPNQWYAFRPMFKVEQR